MSGQIFLSYRRSDSSFAAGRLFDRLKQNFGGENVFMDIDSIELGVDFVHRIEHAVGACDILIAVIGGRWLTATDDQGRRLLDLDNDFVRLEIAAALRRDIFVIPVLVDSAIVPRGEDLPQELAPLSRRNGLVLRHERFEADAGRLVEGIKAILWKKAENGGATVPLRESSMPAAATPRADESAVPTGTETEEESLRQKRPWVLFISLLLINMIFAIGMLEVTSIGKRRFCYPAAAFLLFLASATSGEMSASGQLFFGGYILVLLLSYVELVRAFWQIGRS